MLRFQTQPAPEAAIPAVFHNGEEVFLAKGPYQGTLGVFLNLKDTDRKWADIRERDSKIRSHPVEWLGHSA